MLRTRLKRQKDLWIKTRVEEGLKNLIYFQNKSYVNKVRLQNFNLRNTKHKTVFYYIKLKQLNISWVLKKVLK